MRDVTGMLARWRVPLGFLFGAAALWLAHPTPRSLVAGAGVAIVGEAIRIWAAGHLEKTREVTRSGPYRWTRHPLYVGSTIIGAGVAIAAAQASVVMLVGAYLASTVLAAVRSEEAGMRASFGDEYDAYVESRAEAVNRPFSLNRAIRNREYRAMAGLIVVAAILGMKVALGP